MKFLFYLNKKDSHFCKSFSSPYFQIIEPINRRYKENLRIKGLYSSFKFEPNSDGFVEELSMLLRLVSNNRLEP